MGDELETAVGAIPAELLRPREAAPNPDYVSPEEARRLAQWMAENGYGPPAGYQPPVEETPVSAPAQPEPAVIDLGVSWKDLWRPVEWGTTVELPLNPAGGLVFAEVGPGLMLAGLMASEMLMTFHAVGDLVEATNCDLSFTTASSPAPLAPLPDGFNPLMLFEFDPRKILVGDAGPTAGADVLTGSAGADTLSGLAGHDWLYGYDGDDVLFGQEGDDKISGGEGNDLLFGGDGDPTAAGDPGDFFSGLSGYDLIYGLDGDDAAWGGDLEDRLYGGSGDDTLVGNAASDHLWGGDGDDFLFGGNAGGPSELGADELHGGEGNDALWGEDANDSLFGEADHDYLDGGAGPDLLDGGTGDDTLVGGEGDDLLRGAGGYDNLYGGAGADTFVFKPEPIGDYLSETRIREDGALVSERVNVDHVWDFSAAEGDRLRFEGFPATFDQFRSVLTGFTYEGIDYTVIEYVRLIRPVARPGEGVVAAFFSGVDRITVKGMSVADWTESMVEFAPSEQGGGIILHPVDPIILF